MPKNPFENFEVISKYSRLQAIADGMLIDVSEMARQAGIRYPVTLTTAVWAKCVKVPDGVVGQDQNGRLWDVLVILAHEAHHSRGDTLHFAVHVRNDNRDATPPLVSLKAICGPGDNAEPVITVMFPDED
jgi:Family of unknown function (DUF6573)